MIGTTLKVGFDGQSVSKGLSKIGQMLGSMGKQIGIGGLRKVGEYGTDLLGKIIGAAPEAISQTLDFMGSLNDLSNQTGETVDNLAILQEALRTSGVEAESAGKMLYTMRKGIAEATEPGKGSYDVLQALGLDPDNMRKLGAMDQFKQIMMALNGKGPRWLHLEQATGELFGGKMGMRAQRLIGNVSEELETAAKNTKVLRDEMNGTVGKFDDLGDALGRWQTTKIVMATGFMKGFFGNLDGAKGVVDSINNKFQQMGPMLESLGKSAWKAFEKIFNSIQGGTVMKDIGDWFRQIGKYIGEGIGESLGPKGIIKGIFGGSSNTPKDTASIDILKESAKTNDILTAMRREKSTAAFA